MRARLAEQIRANARDGWGTEVAQRPTVDDVDSFALAYEQTMRRAGAAERYFFARAYFDAALAFERSWLVVARRSGRVRGGAIAAVSDSVLHYFLGATLDDARRASPFKNVVAAMLDLADELGLPLNLGGGVAPGDGLEEFKRGFANSAMGRRTQEVVCDPNEYERLAAGRRSSRLLPRLPRAELVRRRPAGVAGAAVGRRRRVGRRVRRRPVGSPPESIRAWMRWRIFGISRSSALPGHAV